MPNGKPRSGTLEFAQDVREKTSAARPAMAEPEALTPASQATAAEESSAKGPAPDAVFSTMWPWALMQQIQTKMQQTVEQRPHAAPPKPLEKSA